MDIFKLVGSILINNGDANSAIDETTGKASSMASTLASKFESVGNSVTNVGKTLAPVSALATTALTASVVSASNMTDAMAKMSTLFDTAKVSVSDLTNEFVDLSNDVGISATELAEAGYQALSAGVDVENSVAFVETAGKLAKAGFTSTSTAVDILTTAINAYGLSADEADALSNKLVRTQNLGKTTVDELASSMGKIIPTASSMNVNIDNLTTGYVELTKQGIATAEATTYMNSMLNELGDSGTTVGQILQEQTGQSFQELMDSGMSLADVLDILQTNADDTGTNFNELWSSSEAGKSAIAILNAGVDDFNSTLETMESDTDDVGDAIEKLDTPAQKAKEALNQIKNVGIELGSTLLTTLAPVIQKVADAVESATTWFSNLSEGQQQTIMTVVALVAGLSPVLIIVGKIISGIGGVITAVQTLTPAISALNVALNANPIGIIIMAIAGLVTAFVYLWNNCDAFRQFWIDLWDGIQSVVSTVVTAIGNFFTNLWTNITNIWNGIASTISGVWDAITSAVSSAWDTIVNIVTIAGKVIASLFSAWFQIITLPWMFIWENCKDVIIPIWNSITEFLSNAWDAISNVATTVWNAIADFFTGLWNGIKSTATTVWNSISNFFTGVWDGIKNTATKVGNQVGDAVGNAWDKVKTKTSSTWDTVKNNVSSAWEVMKSLASKGGSAIGSLVEQRWTNLKNNTKAIWDLIGNVMSEPIEKAKELISGIVDAIKDIFAKLNISFPDIKLPHFAITPSGWKIGDLLQGSIPTLGIQWYAKGGILQDPTIFGMNGDTPMIGGEAGAEAVAPIDTLLGYIRQVVAEQNASLLQALTDAVSKIADNQNQGDIVIPVYLGNNMIDDIVVNAKRNVTLRSGGMTSV